MVVFQTPTGTAGRLVMDVVYSQGANSTTFAWSYRIECSDGATNVASVGWSGAAAGATNSGAVSLPAGFGSREVWNSNRTINHDANGNIPNQYFELYMGATGTSGLGGPAATTGTVQAPRIPAAPGAPGTPTVSNILSTSVTLSWTAASRGHANISTYQWQISTSSTFSPSIAAPSVGVVLTDNTADNVTLLPGTTYYVRVRARNGDGYGPWSGTRSFKTISGAYVSDGTNWNPAELLVDDGSTARPAEVLVSDGTNWNPAG